MQPDAVYSPNAARQTPSLTIVFLLRLSELTAWVAR
jgi:hypothetical protein